MAPSGAEGAILSSFSWSENRRSGRWTDGSTWLWTSFRNQVGQGEGASNLRFDEVLEPTGATSVL
jgi:hypothetical protein